MSDDSVYKNLLKRYIDHIKKVYGTDLIDTNPLNRTISLSEEDKIELKKLKDEGVSDNTDVEIDKEGASIVVIKDSRGKYRRELRETLKDIIVNDFGITKQDIRLMTESFIERVMESHIKTIDSELDKRADVLIQKSLISNGLTTLSHQVRQNFSKISDQVYSKLTEAFQLDELVKPKDNRVYTEFFDTRKDLIADAAISTTNRTAMINNEGSSNMYIKFAGNKKWSLGKNNIYGEFDIPSFDDFIVPMGLEIIVRGVDNQITTYTYR